LNPRPADYKSAALPTELHQPYTLNFAPAEAAISVAPQRGGGIL